jgi:hypothetical protein
MWKTVERVLDSNRIGSVRTCPAKKIHGGPTISTGAEERERQLKNNGKKIGSRCVTAKQRLTEKTKKILRLF